MISLITSFAVLLIGYLVYGRVTEKVFSPDDRATPAVSKGDGVDFVPMKTWKAFLIQLLNIAGTGPIFGALMGAVFGPLVFLWIVIGSVLVPGDKTPHLITKDMLKLMEPGTVLVDVAIDQGGCFETSRPTTHSEPVYSIDGIIHYCVANIPGAVANTSTLALTNATQRYALALADKGWKQACKDDPSLAKGLNVVDGKITFKAVADVFGLEYKALNL